MDVRLLFHTPEPERAIAAAARLCYAPVGAAELLETMGETRVRRVLKTIITSGHTSTLEHASYTFAIDGVSRAPDAPAGASSPRELQPAVAALRLLRRGARVHRAAGSGGGPRRAQALQAANAAAFAAYRELIEAGVPAEDARYLLPNAMETKIVVTMNVRELLHFFELRCCKRAQWEIRDLALAMLDLAEPTAPYIFMDAGASCRRGACREGKMTCGDPYPKAPKRD